MDWWEGNPSQRELLRSGVFQHEPSKGLAMVTQHGNIIEGFLPAAGARADEQAGRTDDETWRSARMLGDRSRDGRRLLRFTMLARRIPDMRHRRVR